MFLLQKPTPETIQTFLKSQSTLDFSYVAVGATATTPPSGYVVDHTRTVLGQGTDTFSKAKAALCGWEQFELGWVYAWPRETPLQTGKAVAVMAHCFGFWFLNAARIVYVVDEPARFGFAYGTLPGHAESGEERFLVEMAKDETVCYDLLAFSRPNQLLARIGYPLIRHLQKQFARDSTEAVRRAIAH